MGWGGGIVKIRLYFANQRLQWSNCMKYDQYRLKVCSKGYIKIKQQQSEGDILWSFSELHQSDSFQSYCYYHQRRLFLSENYKNLPPLYARTTTRRVSLNMKVVGGMVRNFHDKP